MKIAICAPFMKSDLWQTRLGRASPHEGLLFDEFYASEDIRQISKISYGVGIVALPGAAGLEAVHAFREQAPHLPVLWISDDEKFGLEAFHLRVAMFLTDDCTDEELEDALHRCGIGARKSIEQRSSQGGSPLRETGNLSHAIPSLRHIMEEAL